jgi:hypothetical protein
MTVPETRAGKIQEMLSRFGPGDDVPWVYVQALLDEHREYSEFIQTLQIQLDEQCPRPPSEIEAGIAKAREAIAAGDDAVIDYLIGDAEGRHGLT